MENYHKEREALISEDRSLRLDAHLLGDAVSAAERKADDFVRELRQHEAVAIWDASHPDVENPFPGMGFLTGRKIIEKTRLFEILCQMPKGALLHVHLDATVNTAVLLKLALQQPALHIRVPTALTTENISGTLPEFKALNREAISQVACGSICQQGCADAWVPIAKAREAFDVRLGGPEGFDQWVTAALTINPTEAYKTHATVTKIWQKFTSTFRVSAGLIRFAAIWPLYIREFLISSIEDGISYVEVRINFWYKFMIGTDGEETVPHRQWLLDFDRVLTEVKEEMARQGRGDDFIGARVIYTTIRVITPEELEWYLEDCIALKREFPHLIAGFDLVGDENVLKPLKDYLPQLLRFRERVGELGLDIPFIFHAGETLGDGSHADMNLYDAILLGTKRIGHGFSIMKHPRLMQICRERSIPIEVCPISNEILRLTSSIPMHPLSAMVNHGVPVALSSDDPAIFGNMGLAYDFYQVLASSDINGLLTLGRLARQSLEYSTLERSEKDRAVMLWQKKWDKFVEVVSKMQL